MTDVVDRKTRSKMMSGIRGKDTKPEVAIRQGLHKAGFRYRLHCRSLPGKPDLVLSKYRAIILVHGCFWHGHKCHLFKWPGGERAKFWSAKIQGNIERDARQMREYQAAGWRVAVIWECALKGKHRLEGSEAINTLVDWLRGDSHLIEITCIDS